MNVAAILKQKGRSIVTASEKTRLLDIARTLAERRIGAILILGELDRLAGILSERDIIRALAKDGVDAMGRPAADYMTRDVITCRISDTLEHLAHTMTEGKFRHLPVMEEGRLTGVISIGDVVKERIAETEMETEQLRHYIAAH